MDKNEAIRKEIKKLNQIFKEIPKEKLKLVEHLIQNAAFMAVTLLELQEEINSNGAVIQCQSGNGFETVKDNPAQKAYTTMISRYSQVIAQLEKLMPDSSANNVDEFMEFINSD